jgi:hypothetical protein
MENLIGKNVFVRTVTYHYTGRLVSTEGGFLELADAAWVADSGYFSRALSGGSLNEVEPYPGTCFVSTAAVVDLSEWLHELPRSVK